MDKDLGSRASPADPDSQRIDTLDQAIAARQSRAPLAEPSLPPDLKGLADAALALQAAWAGGPRLDREAIWARVEADIIASPQRRGSLRLVVDSVAAWGSTRGAWIGGVAASSSALSILLSALLRGDASPAPFPSASPQPSPAAPAQTAVSDAVTGAEGRPLPDGAAVAAPPAQAEQSPADSRERPDAMADPRNVPADELPFPSDRPDLSLRSSLQALSQQVDAALRDEQLSEAELISLDARTAAVAAVVEAREAALSELTGEELRSVATSLQHLQERLESAAAAPSGAFTLPVTQMLASVSGLLRAVDHAMGVVEDAPAPPATDDALETSAAVPVAPVKPGSAGGIADTDDLSDSDIPSPPSVDVGAELISGAPVALGEAATPTGTDGAGSGAGADLADGSEAGDAPATGQPEGGQQSAPGYSEADDEVAKVQAEADKDLAKAQAEADKDLAKAQAEADKDLAQAEADKDLAEAQAEADEDLAEAQAKAAETLAAAEGKSAEELAEAQARANEILAAAQAKVDEDLAKARAKADEELARAEAKATEEVARAQAKAAEELAKAEAAHSHDDDDDDDDDDDEGDD